MAPRTLLLSVSVVLLVAGVMQVVPFRDVQHGDVSRPAAPAALAKAVPLQLPGWTGRDEPLGATEFIQSDR